GMRIRVKDVLDLLAAGVSEAEVLSDFPYLEREDILACLAVAAAEADHPFSLPLIVESTDRRTASAQLRGMLAAAGHEANHVADVGFAMRMIRSCGNTLLGKESPS